MAKHRESLKKKVMKTFWRVQQAQMIISVVFWSMTLSGIFYPYFIAKFPDWAGGSENTFFGLIMLFALVLAGIFLFGFVYDKFKFWKEQQLVIVERNPYTSWKLNPIQTMWAEMWVETAKAIPDKTPELEAKIEFYEAWIARLEEIDPWTKEMRGNIRAFALEGDDTVLRTLAKKD
ncbi:MAG: hypothetical protein GWN18_08115 [Thermoplasmata archaeon]|nr:hypothetical protein [Thermoplasmata archaeon]NIS12007.1 hypothetical protein [Thermoplasmata archaeon]NIS19931.1 hypothetical protein [Thermoplasmata archaeon]NIT77121.1 hypothetical protein [Thermoplasmata archaeon]NIU49041.1 hypothetical protein [Thermoplasmata archaeon]